MRQTLYERIADETSETSAGDRVTDDLTLGVDTAAARTRVDALVVDTGLAGGTVRVDDTLRSAVGWGADVTRQTGTGWSATRRLALSVRTAGGRRARVAGGFQGGWWRWWNIIATPERIAGLSRTTTADRAVIDNFTSCVEAAGAETRVGALLVDAGPCLRTLCAHNALGTAAGRTAAVALQTRAHGVVVRGTALAVGAARRRRAWVLWCDWGCLHNPAVGERIAGVALRTRADGNVVDDVTLSVLATSAGTWVATLVADAGLVARTLLAKHTLGTARLVRVARVFCDALAQASVAVGVRTAWRWVARV